MYGCLSRLASLTGRLKFSLSLTLNKIERFSTVSTFPAFPAFNLSRIFTDQTYPMPLDIINPLSFPDWDNLLLSHPAHSFFHTSAWVRVLHESYGYRPFYFASIKDETLETLIPMMEVSSFITGKRSVSLPFTDFCPIIVPDEDAFNEAMDRIIEYGAEAGWKYMEFRGEEGSLDNKPASSVYYTHTLELKNSEENLLKSFRNSTRRNIKKAIKENVKVQISHSIEAVKAFYHLNCKTRKRHGLPPQPLRFFRKLHQHIISQRMGFIALGIYEGQPIAAVVFLFFGGQAIYKYGASDMKYQHLRANNLVMWESIKKCVEEGCTSLSLGRTEPDNKGLLQFKRGWNTKEDTIKYYRYDFIKRAFTEMAPSFNRMHGLFSRMPLWALNLTGSLLYKHVG